MKITNVWFQILHAEGEAEIEITRAEYPGPQHSLACALTYAHGLMFDEGWCPDTPHVVGVDLADEAPAIIFVDGSEDLPKKYHKMRIITDNPTTPEMVIEHADVCRKALAEGRGNPAVDWRRTK